MRWVHTALSLRGSAASVSAAAVPALASNAPAATARPLTHRVVRFMNSPRPRSGVSHRLRTTMPAVGQPTVRAMFESGKATRRREGLDSLMTTRSSTWRVPIALVALGTVPVIVVTGDIPDTHMPDTRRR